MKILLIILAGTVYILYAVIKIFWGIKSVYSTAVEKDDEKGQIELGKSVGPIVLFLLLLLCVLLVAYILIYHG